MLNNKTNQLAISVLVIVVIVLWVVFSGDSRNNPSTQSPVAENQPATESTPADTITNGSTADNPTANAPTENPSAKSPLVADSGFDVKVDGFSFANYGNEKGVTNLKANDMRRMFGDKVCTRIKDGKCTLTSPARQWMKEINAAMDGGHCEGMAVTSLNLFHKIENPNTFGAPKTNDLAFDGNTTLQEEIAYWWATQTTEPTISSMITGKPSDIIKILSASLSQGQNAETFYSIGIYMADGTGGHAVTPVSINDLGGGKVGLNIYDNNWPNDLRTINVDLNDETWNYQASINPNEPDSLYSGNTLELTPSKPRLQTQVCDFCSSKGRKSNTKGLTTFILNTHSDNPNASAPRPNATGSTLFVTPEGKRIGYVDGKLVNEIAGASIKIFKGAPSLWSESGLPIFRIPEGITLTLQIANDPSYKYSVSAYGDGKVVKVSNFDVSATKNSAFSFGDKVSSIKMKSAVKTSPDIYIGDEDNASHKDSSTQFSNVDISEDGEFDVTFDEETDKFMVDGDESGDFDLDVLISDDESDYAFSTKHYVLDKGANAAFDIDAIDKEGASLTFDVDENGDGTYDTQSDLQDSDTSLESDSVATDDLADE